MEIDGKTFIFRVNLGMWTLKSIVSEKQGLFWGFQHTLWGFYGDTWENIHFQCKPRHVTPQIIHLGKGSAVLRVSKNIYRVSLEIHVKKFIFSVKLGMSTPQIDCLSKMSPVLRVSTHMYGVSQEIDGKTFIFRGSLGMWILKSIISQKKHCSEGFNTHL